MADIPVPQQAQALYPDGTPIPEDKIAEAMAQGQAGYAPGTEVYMSWTGKKGQTHRIKVKAEQVPDAMGQGYRPESPSEAHVNNLRAFQEKHPLLSAGVAVGRASADAQRALTLGVPLTTGPLLESTAGTLGPEGVQQSVKEFREHGKVAEQLHPIAAGVGTAATLAATAPVAPGEGLITRGAGFLEEAAPRAAAFLKGVPAATRVGRVAQSAVRTGLATGVDTAGFTTGEQLMQEQQFLADKDLTAERLLASAGRVAGAGAKGFGFGLLFGGGVGGVSKVLGEGGSALLNSKILGEEGLHGLRSLGMKTGQLKQLGRFTPKEGMTAEELAKIQADSDLAEQIIAAAPEGTQKLSEIERRIAGGKAIEKELEGVPGAFDWKKSLQERASLIDNAKEIAGRNKGRFIDELDKIARPDTNEIKMKLNSWLDTLNKTGEEVQTAKKLKENFVDFIKKDATFADLQELRSKIGAYRNESISGVSNLDKRALERQLEKAVEEEIAKISPDLHVQYMGLKGIYSRLLAGSKIATQGATAAVNASHGLSNIASLVAGGAELASHGLGAGLVVGGAVRLGSAVLNNTGRREALIASLYKGIKGGTDSTAIKLSNSVAKAIKDSAFSPTKERLASSASKIISHYAQATEPVRMAETNPVAVASQIAQQVGPVAEVDPDLGKSLNDTIMKDLEYLKEQQRKGVFMNAPLPMSPAAGGVSKPVKMKGMKKSLTLPAGMRVPTSDAARYLRYDRALFNPVGELQSWSTTGKLNPALPDVLRDRRPQLQAQLAQEVMEHASKLATKGQRMNYETRIQVSQLIGAPVDPTMNKGYILTAQTIWGQNASDNPPPMIQPEAGVKAVPAGVRRRARGQMTETESLEFNYDEKL